MGKKTTYTATFADGSTSTRQSEREYAAAWVLRFRKVVDTKYGPADAPDKPDRKLRGFSRTAELAYDALAAARKNVGRDKCFAITFAGTTTGLKRA